MANRGPRGQGSNGPPPAGTLGTVRNAARLMDLMSVGPAYHPLTDLAEQAELTLPTVHRLLKSLVAHGLVRQDPASSRYGLGVELVRLAAASISQHPALTAVSPYMCELRNVTGATIQVAVLAGNSVVYIDRVDGLDCDGVFRERMPMAEALGSAAGQLLLAHSEPAARHELTQDLAVAVDSQQWATWAAAPYVLCRDEGPTGSFEIAVPLLGGASGTNAALCATGSTRLLTVESATEELSKPLIRVARLVQGAIDLGH